jgi:RHS repeat-associated protein
VSAVLAIASPRRIKATHRRRRKVTSGHFVQRYYDPQIGRFLSVDPVTTNFNRYNYANNNPYRFSDPDGRDACPTGTRIGCYQASSTKSGPSQPALSEKQRQKDAKVSEARRSGKLGDGTRLDLKKEEQSFTASDSETKAGTNERNMCMTCDGKSTHVMAFDLSKGESPGHTHGEGIEQIPGRDDASKTARTGETAYVITKTAAFGVEHTPEGYRVRFISGEKPGTADVRALESRIETWNNFQGTGGSACTSGCQRFQFV